MVRTELEQVQDELDAVAATTLQSLGLPGSITALERPTGLPPSLLKKAKEIFMDGGLQKVQHLLQQVSQASQSNSTLLEKSLDLLDQEAGEEEHMLQQYPELLGRLEPSLSANRQWVQQTDQFRETLKQARNGDHGVRAKWDQWAPMISILANGEDALMKHIPTMSGNNNQLDAELTDSARELQLLLETLDDAQSDRARLVAEAKRVAAKDDLRPVIIQEAAKLAHGGSGDVKPEWFEDTFEKELRKYRRLVSDMQEQQRTQERVLERIRKKNEQFLTERQEDSRIKFRERKLQEMELAYWKWREIVGNCEEGLKVCALAFFSRGAKVQT